DVIDVGGESTRPGAEPVDPREEAARVVPAVGELAGRVAAPVSVDAYRADVARRALAAGGHVINDISALRLDENLARVVAYDGCLVVLMHLMGTRRASLLCPGTADVVAEVEDWLDVAVAREVRAGSSADRISLDPGFVFGNAVEDKLGFVWLRQAFRLQGS